MKSADFGENNSHPKTWRILGSNNKNEWYELDNQTNNSVLNGPSIYHNFECKMTHKQYRYIRYQQTDSWYNHPNSSWKYKILLSRIELFGDIYRT